MTEDPIVQPDGRRYFPYVRTSARFPGFPSFGPMFKKGSANVGRYLTLLNLGDGASEAVRRAKACLERSPRAASEITETFEVEGWREHLVGAVALLASPAEARPIECLWRLVDRGSWVSPQLVATLSLTDPKFEQTAAAALDRLVAEPHEPHEPLPPITSPEEAAYRHSVVGPSVGPAKTAAALVGLTGLAPAGTAAEVVNRDSDGSGEIAVRWRKGIVRVFADARIAIPPP